MGPGPWKPETSAELVLLEALRNCILSHCPDSDRIFCGSCTEARVLLDGFGVGLSPTK